MNKLALAMFLAVGSVSFCWADDLTDAITGVDPRSRLTSGTGAALDNAYGPQEPEEEAPPAEEFSEYPTLPSYGLSAENLLDPMGTKEKEPVQDGQFPENNQRTPTQGSGEAGTDSSSSYPLY